MCKYIYCTIACYIPSQFIPATRKGLLVLRPKPSSWASISFTIPSGCYALVRHHSSDLDYMDEDGNRSAIWPAGLHFPYPPWIGVAYLITKQSIVFDLPIRTYKTKDDVNVNIEVSLTFRIMGDPELGEDSYLVRKFVYERKPHGLEKQLSDAHEEAVSALVRLLDHTEVYGIRSSAKVGLDNKINREKESDDFSYFLSGSSSDSGPAYDNLTALSGFDGSTGVPRSFSKRGQNATDIMRKRLNRQFILQGIQILSVVIKNVSLPQEFQSQMEKRTLSISERAEQQILRTDAMQSTRMEAEIQTKIQTLSEERIHETQAGQEIINTEKVKLNDAVSQARKFEAAIQEKSRLEIDTFAAQNEYTTQQVRDTTAAGVAAIERKSMKHASELTATTKLESESYLADAGLIATKNLLLAKKKLAKAEGVTAGSIKEKREFKKDMKKIEIFDTLSPNIILGSRSEDESQILEVADKILEDNSSKISEPSPTSVAAELAVLKFASRGSFNEDSCEFDDPGDKYFDTIP